MARQGFLLAVAPGVRGAAGEAERSNEIVGYERKRSGVRSRVKDCARLVNFVLGDGLFSMSLAHAIVSLFVETCSFAISLAITANGLVDDVVSRWE